MNQKQTKDILSNLFVPRGKHHATGEQLEGVCFSSDCMDEKNTDKYSVYKAVSDAMFNSELTHGFSYEIASRAVDILIEAEDWDNDEDITERVDSAVPIYNSELMQIFLDNHWAVDGACEELGSEGDSVAHAQRGWYTLIERMTHTIRASLLELIEEE